VFVPGKFFSGQFNILKGAYRSGGPSRHLLHTVVRLA
jgi:hypothetical protein